MTVLELLMIVGIPVSFVIAGALVFLVTRAPGHGGEAVDPAE
jgi:hypothetical protein